MLSVFSCNPARRNTVKFFRAVTPGRVIVNLNPRGRHYRTRPELPASVLIQGGARSAVGATSVTHSWTEANTAGWVLSGADIQAVVTSTLINEALTDTANSDNW